MLLPIYLPFTIQLIFLFLDHNVSRENYVLIHPLKSKNNFFKNHPCIPKLSYIPIESRILLSLVTYCALNMCLPVCVHEQTVRFQNQELCPFTQYPLTPNTGPEPGNTLNKYGKDG